MRSATARCAMARAPGCVSAPPEGPLACIPAPLPNCTACACSLSRHLRHCHRDINFQKTPLDAKACQCHDPADATEPRAGARSGTDETEQNLFLLRARVGQKWFSSVPSVPPPTTRIDSARTERLNSLREETQIHGARSRRRPAEDKKVER